jgi:hypothetical protein
VFSWWDSLVLSVFLLQKVVGWFFEDGKNKKARFHWGEPGLFSKSEKDALLSGILSRRV